MQIIGVYDIFKLIEMAIYGRRKALKIIGRKSEIRELENSDKSPKSELVCVYGRRRVGKTFLVEQTFGGYFAFRATGLEKGNTRQQLKAFNQRLIANGDEIKTIPRDWFEAFYRLEKLIIRKDVVLSPYGKKIIFFDEFPWFATPKSDFLLAFEEFWNRCGTQNGDILFIICGSATSWIIKNVIDNTGSLYHRVTSQIFVKPFALAETEKFFRDREFGWSPEQILEFQMVFGGLPFFMDLMNPNESFRQNVDRLLFSPAALLKDETNRLLEATLRKAPIYGNILECLASHIYGKKRVDCQRELDAPDGTFARAVEDLKKCGYIVEYKRNYEKGNPNYLQLVDPFLLFHYHFLAHNKINIYEDMISDNGLYSNWRGHAFETLCLLHVPQIKKALGISGVKTNIYPWANLEQKEKVQIDLVIERDDKITDICEIKYTNHPFNMTKEYDYSLLHKRDVFKEKTNTKNALRIVLISASGLAGVAHTEHISQVITMEDLFES